MGSSLAEAHSFAAHVPTSWKMPRLGLDPRSSRFVERRLSKLRYGAVGCGGSIIKEKAIALCKILEDGSEFAASKGWINRWETHHGVRLVSISGGKLSADAKAAKEFSVKFQEIVEQNELLPCQIYNIDETGLNYKMLLNKTLK